MPLILGTNSIKDTGFDVANSVRLDNNAYFNRTFGSGGSVKKWTWSSWFKVSYIGGNEQVFFSHFDDSSNFSYIKINGNNKLEFRAKTSGSTILRYTLTRRFRDPSAFMHLVVALDTSLATSTDRIKIWINGIRETAFDTSTAPAQDAVTLINSAVAHEIGHAGDGSDYFQGYMSQVCFVDNAQYDADQFGEFDSDSPTIWKPKDVSGLSTGATSFFLDFADSGDLGDDESGNTNDFTENNLAATDQTTDTCTNNFATLNSLINFNSGVFSEGNLAITSGDDTVSTIGLTSGRWYWEAQRTNTTNEAHIGIGVSKGFFSATSVVSSGDRIYVRGGATFVSAVSNLGILTFASNSGTPATISNGDVIGFYLDLESSTKNITVKKNDGATPIIDIDLTYSGEEPIFPFCRMNSGCASSWNFGNPIASLSSANADANGFGSFEFNPTKGGVDYFAICTKNLAEFG
jgi:hypothetical protein